jgi:hypothetical protein
MDEDELTKGDFNFSIGVLEISLKATCYSE